MSQHFLILSQQPTTQDELLQQVEIKLSGLDNYVVEKSFFSDTSLLDPDKQLYFLAIKTKKSLSSFPEIDAEVMLLSNFSTPLERISKTNLILDCGNACFYPSSIWKGGRLDRDSIDGAWVKYRNYSQYVYR